jgi:hypothetical protein
MQASQDIRCNEEELQRLRTEAQRVRMWMIDEPNYIRHRIATRSTPDGIHWPWDRTDNSSLAEVSHPKNVLDILDLWYAQEKLEALERMHEGIQHDMAGVIQHIPEWTRAARRKDLGRGSPWHQREVSNCGIGEEPTLGEGSFLPIPSDKLAVWQTLAELDEQFYRNDLPHLLAEWDEESLSGGEDNDAERATDLARSAADHQVVVAEEELNDEELEQSLGITIATWQAYC